MINKIFKLLKKEYQTLNLVEVSRENLLANFNYLSSFDKQVKVAPVLKSNAYGHGILEIAKILDPLKAPFFCVDSLYEAYELLKAGVKTPILIMGYTNSENLKVKKLPFSFAVYDLETVRVLNEYQPGCGVHIFVDTGMGREGVPLEDLTNFLKIIKQFKKIKVEGLMSHLAYSEKANDPLTKKQLNNFRLIRKIIMQAGIKPKWIHMSNSGGILNRLNPGCNMARVGLALYGINHTIPSLKPVFKLTTKIIQIKNLSKGNKIGYEGTFTAKKDMLTGILPIGYYDGVDRALSNKGFVMIDGVACPIIGRVSMNITIIDLGKVKNPYIKQEVVVYSDNSQDPNSIENVARICNKLPYEILVNLADSTRRVVL
ncbi:MAG: Alanine racemase [Microgenomates group bacterium Gr01-1014_7]|nr:MAG: Alanine racemase [Microgenomates group bacterium Gr01-1014_7]